MGTNDTNRGNANILMDTNDTNTGNTNILMDTYGKIDIVLSLFISIIRFISIICILASGVIYILASDNQRNFFLTSVSI